MNFGLKEETINKIISVLERVPQLEEAILYGSRAKGTFKPGSDIDLTLRGNLLNLDSLRTLGIELDRLALPYTFDLSIFHQIENPDLLDHISRIGKVFYKRKT